MGASKPSSLSTAFAEIRLLLWKNFLIQWRHPMMSLVELLLPCLLVFILSMFRGSVDVTTFPKPTAFPEFSLSKVESNLFPLGSKFALMYTPPSQQIDEIMAQTVAGLKEALKQNEINFNALPFNDSTAMEHYYTMMQNVTRDGQVLCGVEFVVLSANQINFKLRFSSVPRHYTTSYIQNNWETIHIMPELISPGPREKSKGDGGKPGYAREGYLLVQHELTLAAAKVLHVGQPVTREQFQWSMARFPFPPYVSDLFLFALSFFFPAVVCFSFIYSSVNLSKNLVIEKEKRLKESMKMMGLKERHHWIAYFIKSITWTLPSLIIVVVLLCTKLTHDMAILNFSSPLVLFLFFLCYEISNICFSFMISTFFTKANLAGIATGVVFFFTFLPFFTVVAQYSTVSSGVKIALLLLPNSNMALGVYIIAMKESRAVGVKWANIAEPALPGDNLNLLLILGFKLINSAIYLLVTWYITQAFPGEYGIALPWYFPFTLDYWRGGANQEFTVKDLNLTEGAQPESAIEKDPPNLRVGIKIMNLSKSYDGGKTYSVKNLNLNIFHSQIISLLGHNGAGKTTVISILCGLFKPTSGTAMVDGYDIRTGMNSIRSSLGICPQFNVLFDELTVEEHLDFYCKLKRADMDAKEIRQETRAIIEKLDLVDKRKVQASKLSGGMQRKLSIGIAFCGGSSVVILDEPTTGIDANTRRFIWDLLLKEKEHRSIILSTHFMEEADILSDKIAIMANGQLQCCGSPMFLKRRYGSGYGLTVAKQNDTIKTDQITAKIQRHIADAKLESSVGTEVIYSLPDDKANLFEPLLAELESDKSSILNFGITVTTMEEVFLKVGDYAKEKMDSMTNSDEPQMTLETKRNAVPKNSGLSLLGQQLYALVVKKMLYSARSPFLTGAQLLIPLIILNLSLLSQKAIPHLKESPPLHMELTQFHNPQVTYFYDPSLSHLAKNYADAIRPQVQSSADIANVDPTVIASKILSSPINVYNYEFMISAVISRNSSTGVTKMTGLFNNQAFHTPSIALKYLDESFIRYVYNKSNLSITVTNWPLPLLTSDNLKMSVLTSQLQYQIMQSFVISISFLVGSFAVLAVKERITKGKHLQRLSGVRTSVFWISYFLTDFVIYVLSTSMLVVTFWLYKENGLYQGRQPFYLFLGVTLHGFAILPCVYSLSFMFSAPATAYARLCLYMTVLGIASILSDQITSIKSLDLLDKNRILTPIFGLLIPVYSLAKVAANLMQNYDTNQVCGIEAVQWICSMPEPLPLVLPCCKGKCGDVCVPYEENFLSLTEPGIGGNLLYIVASALIYTTLLCLIENNVLHSLKRGWVWALHSLVEIVVKGKRKSQPTNHMAMEITDDDVELEKKRIDAIDPQKSKDTNPLIVRRLVKRFGNFTAVNGISYSVERATCFGLLGVNGAGKTTTFKMLSGDLPISKGDVFVKGMNLKTNLQRAQQEIGYCPQFDAVLDDLTGRETLTLYARLRGIRASEIEDQIKELSKLLYFEMHLEKRVAQLSGGNKRKLSTAIAFLGNPSIILVDEASSGVDSVAKRCIWNTINHKIKLFGCSVVLTSHSMEECEALCNKLIIMVNGTISCIGTPLQLKSKFGNGYTVLIRVTPSSEDGVSWTSLPSDTSQSMHRLRQSIALVQQFMRDTFASSSLKAVHNNLLHYSIDKCGDTEVKCSQIFGALERAKNKLNIEDYSVCQTNLEQIFINFAKQQRAEDSKDEDAQRGDSLKEIKTRL